MSKVEEMMYLNLLELLMESSKVQFYLQFYLHFVIVGFADDLKHLSPSWLNLQRILNICKFFRPVLVLLLMQRRLCVLNFIVGII